jgi:hypothetical protein
VVVGHGRVSYGRLLLADAAGARHPMP